ncbi:MAG: LLM class flavin-dependent oxidoreductase [Pseudomonadota bacterium]|nr:LLM class flavin-dependent oxidoreductase [Pseudomonadota bacterium]
MAEGKPIRFGTYSEMQSLPGGSYYEDVWETLRHIELADRLGYEYTTTLEHFFFPGFSISADPLAFFSAAAQRTRRIRFRTVCHVLPLHNPMVLASQLATADILTDGRIDFGVGRGHGWIHEPAGMQMEESQQRYLECLEIVTRGLSQDKLTYDGKFWSVEDVEIVPKPVQKPYPKVYMAGTSGAAFRVAAQNGWGIVCGGPAPFAFFHDAIQIYRDACREFGTEPDVCTVRTVYMDEDADRAHREIKDVLLTYYQHAMSPIDSVQDPKTKERLLEAGYGFYAGDAFQQMRAMSYDDIIDQEMALVGTPDQVAQRLGDFLEQGRYQEFSVIHHLGGIQSWQVTKTLELFARQVRPALDGILV